jgi:thiol-disulfide isomerase/thioredoxin
MNLTNSKFIWLITILLCILPIKAFTTPDYASLDKSLANINGNKDRLSDYIGHGKWVVLNIWGTRCPPCREEMPELVRFHDEHKDKDAIVVGIAIDFPSYGYAKFQQVKKFTDDYFIDFPVLLSDASITERIGLGRLEALPSTYLFSPAGDIVAMQVGAITQIILENFISKIKQQTVHQKSIKKNLKKTE